jgi:2,4-dichlorophenol 6-monooxygenase
VAQRNADQSLRNALKLIQIPAALGVDEEPTTARMNETLASPAGRSAVGDAIANQAEHFDMLGLQLGYVYGENEVGAPDPDRGDPDRSSARRYRPSSRPGARLPHVWLERAGERISSLDLVAVDALTLLTGSDDPAWAKAAESCAPVPVVLEVIDAKIPDVDLEAGGALLVRPDQHVAWRTPSLPDDPSGALRRALAAFLGPAATGRA